MQVSIHAPARGATYKSYYEWRVKNVSIHAPARGATQRLTKTSSGMNVSIHAPARGATGKKELKTHLSGFQSTLLREERLIVGNPISKASRFNPRSCARSDIARKEILPACKSFNPRSCARSDMKKTQRCNACRFQSTLLREERHYPPFTL